MSWRAPFSPNAPKYDPADREERLQQSRRRAGKKSSAILKRRSIYRKWGIEDLGPMGRPRRKP